MTVISDTGWRMLQARLPEGYVPVSVLGHGGGTYVILARSRRFSSNVAIKIAHTDEWIESIRNEAEVLADLRDVPGVVQLRGFEENGGDILLILEPIKGASLTSLLRLGGLTFARAFRLLADLAETLGQIHGAGVMHGDVKPDNVLVTNSLAGDRVTVIDFGFATRRSARMNAYITGSPVYMSPEAFSPTMVFNPPRDWYALGVMLFEICTGIYPFRERTAAALYLQHAERRVPTLSSVRPNLRFPPELQELIERLLAKDPHDRQMNGEVVAREIRRLIPRLGFLRTLPVPGAYVSLPPAEAGLAATQAYGFV